MAWMDGQCGPPAVPPHWDGPISRWPPYAVIDTILITGSRAPKRACTLSEVHALYSSLTGLGNPSDVAGT